MSVRMDARPVVNFLLLIGIGGLILAIFAGIAVQLSNAGVNTTQYFDPIKQGWHRGATLLGISALVAFFAIGLTALLSKLRGAGISIG